MNPDEFQPPPDYTFAEPTGLRPQDMARGLARAVNLHRTRIMLKKRLPRVRIGRRKKRNPLKFPKFY